jgi:hypothetical protein
MKKRPEINCKIILNKSTQYDLNHVGKKKLKVKDNYEIEHIE